MERGAGRGMCSVVRVGGAADRSPQLGGDAFVESGSRPHTCNTLIDQRGVRAKVNMAGGTVTWL